MPKKSKFVAIQDRSEGKWTPIKLPEAAVCLVCRHHLEIGEDVMCSPGRYVRHPDCIWPINAQGGRDEKYKDNIKLVDTKGNILVKS
jgi:hypothetical protein